MSYSSELPWIDSESIIEDHADTIVERELGLCVSQIETCQRWANYDYNESWKRVTRDLRTLGVDLDS